MPKARNVAERCRQVLAWVESEWPSGRIVTLHWRREIVDKDTKTGKRHQCHGETWRDGRVMHIALSRKKCRRYTDAVETLIHEYVHVLQWGPASLEHCETLDHHPSVFWVQQGEILDRYHHHGGAEEASEYAVGR